MNNYDFLKDEVMDLPIIYENDDTCEDAIIDRIESYKCFLQENRLGDETLYKDIEEFEFYLGEMYDEYYLGHHNEAYKQFLKAFEYGLDGMKTKPVKSSIPKEALYRARVNVNDVDYSDVEMFHINYKSRTKVQTQRYSFPGLPCLYLGASSYVCWLELGRPSFEQFQIAKIVPQRDGLEVIDLSIHPVSYYEELIRQQQGMKTEHENLSLERYLAWWPIMAACSIVVKNREHPFKPEYIFPQFVLQYILENEKSDCIGIRYMSTKAGAISLEQYRADYRTYTNYVFPIKSLETTDNGYCIELAEQFKIESNMSGKELQLISISMVDKTLYWVKYEKEAYDSHGLDNTYIELKNGNRLDYSKSVFWKMERILDGGIMEELMT